MIKLKIKEVSPSCTIQYNNNMKTELKNLGFKYINENKIHNIKVNHVAIAKLAKTQFSFYSPYDLNETINKLKSIILANKFSGAAIMKSTNNRYKFSVVFFIINSEFQVLFDESEIIIESNKKYTFLYNFKPKYENFDSSAFTISFNSNEIIILPFKLYHLKNLSNTIHHTYYIKPENIETTKLQCKIFNLVKSIYPQIEIEYDYNTLKFKTAEYDGLHLRFKLQDYNTLDELLISVLSDFNNCGEFLKFIDNYEIFKNSEIKNELTQILLKFLKISLNYLRFLKF